jgi:hypothetical protein
MTTRFTKGKARTEAPRLKDLATPHSVRDPSEGRANGGRFASGNRAAIGQGWKATIRKALGAMAGSPQVEEIVRQATSLYVATLRALPADDADIRQLVAARCRNAALGTFYANEAARVGLATPEGLKLAEAARAHDKTAQGLSTTAYDRAVRVAAVRPNTPADTPWLVPSDEGKGATT